MTDISAFRRAKVLVVGDVMLDRYCWGTVTRISPEAPVPIVKLERQTDRPGGAANVAANVISLGATAYLVGIVGPDREGEQLTEAITAIGVVQPKLIASDSRPTIIKTRIIAHGQQIVRLDSEAIKPLDVHEQSTILAETLSYIPMVDLVLLSDYGKGLLTEEVVQAIIQECSKHGRPVLADPKGKHFQKYAGAFILTPNRREAAEACKLEEGDVNLVPKAGRILLEELDLANVLITESENGMTIFRKDGSSTHYGTTAREVFDVTGAGDTVIACLGVAIAAGFTVETSVRFSNIAAGISVQHIGAAAISLDELESELAHSEDGPLI